MSDLLVRLFVKDYRNVAHFKVRERYGKFASIVGIITNLLLFLIKILAGLMFNSIAIIADAINNLSDSGSSIVTLVGFKISAKPADAEHPYGHARMEYISGLIVSFIILYLGGQLIQSSIDKIIHPQTTQFSLVSLAVLLVSILLKLWQCLFYRNIGKRINSTTLIATSYDSQNDILATSAVMVAMVVTYFTRFNLDGYMGVVVAVFILITGIKLVKETISPLLGLAPTEELVNKITKKILSYEGILGLHDLSVHNYGEGRLFASVHCEVCAVQDIMVSHDIIDNIERDLLKDMDIHLVIHLDPIITDDERTNALKAEIIALVAQMSPDIGLHDFRVVWGLSHSNLIFDVVVPFDFKWSDEELIGNLTGEICNLDPSYRPVITVDHKG